MANQGGDRSDGQYTKPQDTPDESPYGPGFIAAAVVMAAVLLCGAVVVVTGIGGGDATATSGTMSPAPASDPAGSDPAGSDPGAADPAVPDPTAADPGASDPTGRATAGSGRTDPTRSTASNPVSPGVTDPAEPAGANGSGGCALAAGDQAVPVAPPANARWEVYRRTVVPATSTLGPGRTDPDGLRRCFAHSPSGALLAAYNVVAAFGDNDTGKRNARRLLLPGPDTERLLRELAAEPDQGTRAERTQVAGFRVVDASRDRVTLALALRVGSTFVSATFTLVWHESDWRLVSPRGDDSIGEPMDAITSLDGYVAWSGV